MKSVKAVIVGLLALVASYYLARWTQLDVQTYLADVLLPFGGALTGIVLATVAIIMGSVGATYAAVAARDDKADKSALTAAFSALDAMVRELKHDCVLVIVCFGVMLITYLCIQLDVPWVSLPSAGPFSKGVILATASLFACIASFIAMLDTVGAVFAMHEQTAAISKQL